MKNPKYVFACLGILLFVSASAGSISGAISDIENGKALSGSNVYLKNAGNGTVTDDGGTFLLKVPDSGSDTLIVSMIGYERWEKSINYPFNERLKIQLRPTVLQYRENVLVTATRMPVDLRETTVSSDLIDRQEIEAQNPQNLAELLGSLRSMQIKDYGGIGNQKSISLRGASAAQVLILMNGRRINNPQNGETDLSLITADHIDRVEVVRGGTSAIYGSDAVGGIVHIITREPDTNKLVEFGINQTLASFGTYSLHGEINASLPYANIISTYQYLDSQSDFSYIDPSGEEKIRQNNAIRRHHIFSSVDLNVPWLSENSDILFNYNFLSAERGAPGTLSYAYLHASMKDIQHDASMKFTKRSNDLRHVMQSNIYYSNHFNHYINEDPSDVMFPVNDRYTTAALGSDLQMSSKFFPALVLNYGISLRADRFYNHNREELHRRFSYDIYVVDESIFNFKSPVISGIRLTPSLRYNGNTDFSNTLTPKIGLLTKIGRSGIFSFISNAGYSYRAPTFNDLYWPADTYTSGNPELEPEYGFDWDIGLRFAADRIFFESVYFNQSLTNLINWDGSSGIWRPENIASAKIRGVENMIKIQLFKRYLSAVVNYTYMDARNVSDGNDAAGNYLAYRARHSAAISLRSELKKLLLSFNTKLNGKRYSDALNTESLALPAYIINDVSLQYRTSFNMLSFELSAEVRNIFNVSYQVLNDLPMPGREYRASLGILWKKLKD